VTAYTTRHGSAPVGLAALTYDAVQLIADAARRAGSSDRVALKKALATTRDFPGVTGRTTLDENRNTLKDAAIIAVRGGRCVYVESIRP
jgi:branched-chain amino acid transport system substrate-binding protein